jgi:hypothetical protein
MQVQVGTELQSAIRVWNREDALDVVGNRFGSGIGQVIDRQDENMVANTDAAVLAAIALETGLG